MESHAELGKTGNMNIHQTIVVYTSIVGGFDPPRTDILNFDTPPHPMGTPRLESKYFKMNPHRIFTRAITIWLDGNIHLNVDESRLVDDFLGDADIGVFRHPFRQSVWEECDACITLAKDDAGVIRNQLATYRRAGFGDDMGLAECGVIIRRNNERVRGFNQMWWSHVCRHSIRDQISFPFVMWQNPDVKIKINDGNVRNDARFTYVNHLKP
jgi:hypothetical protein